MLNDIEWEFCVIDFSSKLIRYYFRFSILRLDVSREVNLCTAK